MELEGIISLLSFYFISPLQSAQNIINGRHNQGLVNLCLTCKICKKYFGDSCMYECSEYCIKKKLSLTLAIAKRTQVLR